MNAPEQPELESEIENIFEYELLKYSSADVSWRRQVEFQTIGGLFRPDFVASVSGCAIGLECDGRGFHDLIRDECRDALILGDGFLNTIYRFTGKNIFRWPADCLYFLSLYEPWLFSARGHNNLRTLASPELRAHEPGLDSSILIYRDFIADDGSSAVGQLIIIRRSSDPHPTPPIDDWREFYEFARGRGGGRFKTLLQEYNRNHA